MTRVALTFILTLLLATHLLAQPCTQQVIASHNPTFACTDRPLNFSASFLQGASYSWTGPSSASANTQNFTITNLTTANSGDYIVTATVGSCVYKDTVAINVGTTPAMPQITGGKPSYCEGDTIDLMASCITLGVTYKWGYMIGGSLTQHLVIPNAKTINTGYFFAYSNNNGCLSERDSLYVLVKPANPPSATLNAIPDTIIIPGNGIKFTTFATNAGQKPSYRWTLNGVLKDTTAAFTATIISAGDVVCIWVKADSTCAAVDTVVKCVTVHYKDTSTNIQQLDKNKFSVYPNPNNGRFTITIEAEGALNILNALGQTVYSANLSKGRNEIDLSSKLPNGIYVLSTRSLSGELKQQLHIAH